MDAWRVNVVETRFRGVDLDLLQGQSHFALNIIVIGLVVWKGIDHLNCSGQFTTDFEADPWTGCVSVCVFKELSILSRG